MGPDSKILTLVIVAGVLYALVMILLHSQVGGNNSSPPEAKDVGKHREVVTYVEEEGKHEGYTDDELDITEPRHIDAIVQASYGSPNTDGNSVQSNEDNGGNIQQVEDREEDRDTQGTTPEPRDEEEVDRKETESNGAGGNSSNDGDDGKEVEDNSTTEPSESKEVSEPKEKEVESKVEEEEEVEQEITQSNGTDLGTFEATAYIAFCDTGCTGVTATGVDVSQTIYHEGMRVIAVDPNVIPLYSIVEVSYGGQKFTAIALDTGGNIKGRRVDLLVGSTDEAFTFGRRDIQVRLIE